MVDPAQEKIVWAMQGPFAAQHDPRVLDNGNLLVFDNESRPRWSRVLEIDPVTERIAWDYTGLGGVQLYSHCCGTAYRLANGNTLINETDAGRSLEVTPEREIVWEFYNPHRAGEDDRYIAALFDLVRFPGTAAPDWLRGR